MLARCFLLLALVVPVLGCGDSGPRVLEGEVAKDPSLSDDFYDEEKYNAMIDVEPAGG